MASIFTEDFEGVSNGSDITSSNTDYALFGATKPVGSNAQFITGGMSCRVDNTGGATTSFGGYTHGSAVSAIYQRAYVRFNSLGGTSEFMRVKSSATLRAELRFNSAGNSGAGSFQMRNSTSSVYNSTHVPVTGQWYRVEWRVDNTASQQQLRLFYGANLHGSTADVDSGNQTYNQGTMNRIVIGNEASNAVLDFWFDDHAVDDSTWVGPASVSNDYTQTPTDSAGFTDSPAFARVMEIANLLLDGDSRTASVDFERAVTNNAGVGDTATAFLGTVVLLEDGEDITDSVSFARGLTVGDSLGVVDEDDEDLVAGGGSFTETPSDVLGITDGTPQFGWDGQGTDPVDITDSVVVSKDYLVEDLGITDGAPAVGLAGEGTDPVPIADSITTSKTATTGFIVSVTDPISIGESDVGQFNWEVLEEEDVLTHAEDFQAAFTPAPVTGVQEELGVVDLVTVEHGIDAGFNWQEDLADLLGITDSSLVDHTVVQDLLTSLADAILVTESVSTLLTVAPNSVEVVFDEILVVTDQTTVGIVAIPPGLVRVVITRSIRGPRCEDWFWRHYPFLPQPTQVALLVYPDGRVLETDDLLSDEARNAPFIAGGGYQTILESDSWQAQVLSAAGYELEPVT